MVALNKSLVTASSIKQRPEIELLLCCTRTQMSIEYAERIRYLVSQNIDWDELVNTARRHEVLPLFYWQLKNVCPELVPPDVLVQLRSNFNANAKRNLALTAKLLKLIKLFQQLGIPIIPFKGSVLAISVYKNLGLREFIDLDILVPEQFVLESSKLLKLQGYKPQFNISDDQISNYAKVNNEQAFWHEEQQVAVDLHWELLPKPFPSYSALAWSSKEQVYLRSTAVQSISAETLLLFLCAHGAKHSWSHLKFLIDIAELIRSRPDLNWDLIEEQSEKLGSKKVLFLGLYLCQELLGTVLPDSLVRQLQANQLIKKLALRVQQQAFLPNDQANNAFGNDDIYIGTLSFKEQLWLYFRVLVAPTPIELTMISLPRWLFSLYYLLRPIRLFIKYALMQPKKKLIDLILSNTY